MDIQEQIFNAIDVIIEAKLQHLSFDQCIEGVITSDGQKEDGSYNFLYQGVEFNAFPLSNTQSFNKGDIVYVLVIGNDLGKKKVIVTGKAKEGDQFINVQTELSKIFAGKNYVNNVETEFVLYSSNAETVRTLNISPEIITATTFATHIRISADVESELTETPNADYGIRIQFKYGDGAIREHALSINEIVGYPFRTTGRKIRTEQMYLDDIPTEVVKAELYINGFPDDLSKYVKFTRPRIEFVEEAYADLEKRIPYKVEVISSRGTTFRNGDVDTLLTAIVKYGNEDITANVEPSRLRWKRTSLDPEADAIWNSDPEHIGKLTMQVTHLDVYQQATFSCDLSD